MMVMMAAGVHRGREQAAGERRAAVLRPTRNHDPSRGEAHRSACPLHMHHLSMPMLLTRSQRLTSLIDVGCLSMLCDGGAVPVLPQHDRHRHPRPPQRAEQAPAPQRAAEGTAAGETGGRAQTKASGQYGLVDWLVMTWQAAKEAEALVLEKMKCQDYVILCVEVSSI